MDEQYNMLDLVYYPPWTRIGPYLIGMITAYLITRLNGKLSLKKVLEYFNLSKLSIIIENIIN